MATAVPPATGNGRKAPQGLPSGRFVARDLDRSVPRGHRPASRQGRPASEAHTEPRPPSRVTRDACTTARRYEARSLTLAPSDPLATAVAQCRGQLAAQFLQRPIDSCRGHRFLTAARLNRGLLGCLFDSDRALRRNAFAAVPRGCRPPPRVAPRGDVARWRARIDRGVSLIAETASDEPPGPPNASSADRNRSASSERSSRWRSMTARSSSTLTSTTAYPAAPRRLGPHRWLGG